MSAAHIFLEISLGSLIAESGVKNQAEFPAANWPQFCVFSLSHQAVIFLLGTWEQIHSLAPLFFVLISLVPIRGCLVAVIQSPHCCPSPAPARVFSEGAWLCTLPTPLQLPLQQPRQLSPLPPGVLPGRPLLCSVGPSSGCLQLLYSTFEDPDLREGVSGQ